MISGIAPIAGYTKNGPIWILRIHSGNSFGSCLSIGEPSNFPTSHSCHKFHISWLCIVGAIKNVKTWRCRPTNLEMWHQPELTSEYFHAYIRLPISPLTPPERPSREFRSMSTSIAGNCLCCSCQSGQYTLNDYMDSQR